MYAIWIRIDETLPWIELKGTYQTRKEARKEAEGFLGSVRMRIVTIPETRKQVKQLATIRHR